MLNNKARIEFNRKCIILFTLLCALMYMPICVQVSATEEYIEAIPDDFDLQINQKCSGHDCFMQFSVDPEGYLLLVSRYTNITERKQQTYRLCYVDVYTPMGTHIVELSFYTEHDFVAELQGDNVVLYFDDRIITVDIVTKETKARMTSLYESMENGTYARLRKSKVTVGNRTYKAQKALHGYRKLICTDKNGVVFALSFKGTVFNAKHIFLSLGSAVGILVLLKVWKNKTIGKKNTGK